ncbi:MAG: hypothetical protein ACI9FG_002038 [Crocinitomicaceae bacterium]|jgi:hypothetical protein
MKTITNMKKITKLSLVLSFIGSAALQAQLINVNFETFTPRRSKALLPENKLEGPAGGLGTEWNQFLKEAAKGATSPVLVDSKGAKTTITIQTNFTEARSNGKRKTPIYGSYATDFGKAASRTVTIAGLNPKKIYDVWVSALRSGGDPFLATWSTPNPVSIKPTQVLDNRLYKEIFNFEEGANYIVFRAVEADASGTVILNVQGASPADGFDGKYRAGLSGLQISPGTPFVPLEITNVSFSKKAKKVNVTWQSNPGESYGIYFSKDNKHFTQYPPAVIPASASGHKTSLTSFVNPFPNAKAKPYIKIGRPDLVDPKAVNIWTNGSSLNLVFSEQIRKELATNPANFTLTDGSGASVPVASANYGLTNKNIILTPKGSLKPKEAYTVTMNNLTDNAGRALRGSNKLSIKTFDNNPKGVKVFILAGQSNMVGRGESEKGNGGVAGAIGSLRYMVKIDPKNYGHLVDGKGNWAARSDVKIKWGNNKGELQVGFGKRAQFGPEIGAGNVLGDAYTQPILIIKAAWGGKSLETDFRSPRQEANRGGETGFYYLAMMEQVRDALDDFQTEFPELVGQGYQIAGFGWHQGINDVFSAKTSGNYEANMVDFIKSVRDELGQPNLPFSIATTSHKRDPMPEMQTAVINAQLAVADAKKYPEFAGNVFSTDAAPFHRELAVSPDGDWTHWNDNGETLYLIGKAIGDGLVKMISSK